MNPKIAGVLVTDDQVAQLVSCGRPTTAGSPWRLTTATATSPSITDAPSPGTSATSTYCPARSHSSTSESRALEAYAQLFPNPQGKVSGGFL